MINKKDVYRWARRQNNLNSKPLPMPQRLALLAALALLIALAVLNRTSAQDATPLNCDAALMQGFQTDLDKQNKLIADAAAAGDVAAWLDQIRQSRIAYAVIDSHCRGMSFSSEVDGQQPVLGPIIFADGIWKATFTTEGMGQALFEIISGDCDQFTTPLLFNGGFSGEFKTGAQNVFTTADNCMAMVKVGLVDKPWTLAFELVAPAQ